MSSSRRTIRSFKVHEQQDRARWTHALSGHVQEVQAPFLWPDRAHNRRTGSLLGNTLLASSTRRRCQASLGLRKSERSGEKQNCSSQNLELYWLVRFTILARAFRLATSFELKYEPGSCSLEIRGERWRAVPHEPRPPAHVHWWHSNHSNCSLCVPPVSTGVRQKASATKCRLP